MTREYEYADFIDRWEGKKGDLWLDENGQQIETVRINTKPVGASVEISRLPHQRFTMKTVHNPFADGNAFAAHEIIAGYCEANIINPEKLQGNDVYNILRKIAKIRDLNPTPKEKPETTITAVEKAPRRERDMPEWQMTAIPGLLRRKEFGRIFAKGDTVRILTTEPESNPLFHKVEGGYRFTLPDSVPADSPLRALLATITAELGDPIPERSDKGSDKGNIGTAFARLAGYYPDRNDLRVADRMKGIDAIESTPAAPLPAHALKDVLAMLNGEAKLNYGTDSRFLGESLHVQMQPPSRDVILSATDNHHGRGYRISAASTQRTGIPQLVDAVNEAIAETMGNYCSTHEGDGTIDAETAIGLLNKIATVEPEKLEAAQSSSKGR